jgi:hypothetical protein
VLLHAAHHWLWLLSVGARMLSTQGLLGVRPHLMIFVCVFDIRLFFLTLLAAPLLICLLQYALVALYLLLEVLLERRHPILHVHLSDDRGGRIIRLHTHWVGGNVVLLVDLGSPSGVLSLGDVLFRHVLILVRRMCHFIAGGTAGTCSLLVYRAWGSYEGARLCLRDLLRVLWVVRQAKVMLR